MADTPPLVAIREANTHLQALHERNVELEKEVIQLRSMLALKQEQEERLLGQQQILKEKDEKISYLETEIKKLICQSKETSKKDLLITQLTRKIKLLNEILKYKSALESITVCLEQVEEDFIVDIDNLMNIGNGDGNNNKDNGELDVKNLANTDHETTL
ncbi:vimentin-type intermediate filament-associated coiled-coil protein-like [Hydractinia symbiolongicarpus]|uniref:vimentin-type intermediate filament-associated coiled-coil protein-like n=1 Tax=Hydractinia symbiolongicarpus TaxID=13093 RepID=UPI00254D2612|nr:vimentin-type intermediate filament-associated coiled-coil protein-like [Hydractinia symbiolongicarpus]